MKIRTPILYTLAAFVLAAAVALSAGCSGLETAADAAALDRGMDRAERIIGAHADNLPEADAREVREAFGGLREAHEALRSPDADMAWHYDRARDSYQRLRAVAEAHWDELAGHEQRWAEDIHQRAVRLDSEVQGRAPQVRDYVELAAALARLLIYVKVV